MMNLCIYLDRKYEVLKVRKIVNFQIFKIYVAMQNGCNGDFAPILEFRTYNAKCGKIRELFKMICLHLTKKIRKLNS